MQGTNSISFRKEKQKKDEWMIKKEERKNENKD